MYYVIETGTSFTAPFRIGFEHCGRFDRLDRAINFAEELRREGGHQYSVMQMQIVHTTETINDADLDEESEANADRQFADPTW